MPELGSVIQAALWLPQGLLVNGVDEGWGVEGVTGVGLCSQLGSLLEILSLSLSAPPTPAHSLILSLPNK